MPYPPGLDLGAQQVEALLKLDEDGRVEGATAWTGPEPLVEAVQATVGACRLAEYAPGAVQYVWPFPEPPVNVTGVLRARGTRAPAAGVYLVIGDRTVTTDDEGRFSVRNLAPGTHEVRVPASTWHLDDVRFDLTAGERVELDLWATPELGGDDELVARYTAMPENSISRTIGLDEARALPGSLSDPLRALAAQPGLYRTPYDAGWLLVRGGDFDDTGLFLDGVRVPLVFHLGGFTSVLHPELIEQIRFYPGLFPARYGNALSGVVDVVPGDVGDESHVVGGLNIVFAHAFVETPTPWGGIALAARRSWLDGLLTLAIGPEQASIAPRFWDVQARARIGEGSITFVGMHDAIDAPSFSGDGILTIVQRGAQLQGVVPLGDHVTIRPWVAWTARDVTGDVTPQAVEELHPGLRVEATTDPTLDYQVLGGVEGERRGFLLERGTEERRAPVYTVEPYAGMSMGRDLRIWSEIRGTAALTPEQDARLALSPRGGVRWRPDPVFGLYAEFGRTHQLPPPTLMIGLSEGQYLLLEQSDQIGAGVQVGPRALRADLAVWERFPRNLGELELDGSLGLAEGHAYGAEARVQASVGGFDGSALYQYTRSLKWEDPGDPIGPSPFDQPHRVELFAAQDLPHNWLISARFRYSSGFPRVVEEGRLVPTEAYDLLMQETVPLGLSPQDERLAPYHSLDLKVAHTWTFRTWRMQTSLDVQNVYNRRVVEPVITGFGESRPSYGFGLPILPILAIEGEFFP